MYVRHFSRELARRGHRVTIVTRGGPRPRPPMRDDGLRILPTPFLPAYPFHVDVHARLMAEPLSGNGGEAGLVHCHSPLTLPPPGDRPVVSTFHSTMARSLPHLEVVDATSLASRLARPFSVRVETKLLGRSDLVSAVSDRTRRTLAEEYGLSAPAIPVLGNGVDAERFRPLRGRDPPRTVLYVGRLAYGKGLFDLVRVAKLVLQSQPEWSFTLVGRGPLASRIERLRRASQVPASKFVLKGFVPHDRLPDEYQRAQLFVLPSHHEGVPTALLEAMASGLPVVATRVGGVAEVIQDGKHGLLCPPGHPEGLARRILEAIEDEGLRARLAKDARSHVRRRFTWSHVAGRWIEAVQRQLPGILT